MATTPKGPLHLPAVPSRTHGSYWTWDPALLASPPRTTRLQVGEDLHPKAIAPSVWVLAMRTAVVATRRLTHRVSTAFFLLWLRNL